MQILFLLFTFAIYGLSTFVYPGIGMLYALNLDPTSLSTPPSSENCNEFTNGILEEAGDASTSTDKCWWLDSGGIFYVKNGIGKTIQESLPEDSVWNLKYKSSNPLDTDNGSRPQNIFRLINKEYTKDQSQELVFKVTGYHLSPSPNRNESNGVLLMSRYVDENNLYYAGLRVDGMAVIKKKTGGVYSTLGMAPYIHDKEYDRTLFPILLPMNKWIGERLVTKNNSDGSVDLTFYINLFDNHGWSQILHVTDTQKSANYPPIDSPGNTGIRSDFMDVEFSGYRLMQK